MATTITQIARWRYVPGKVDEVDHLVHKCPLCFLPNRVRLGKKNAEVERSVCGHFRQYEYKRTLGVVEFRFAYVE